MRLYPFLNPFMVSVPPTTNPLTIKKQKKKDEENNNKTSVIHDSMPSEDKPSDKKKSKISKRRQNKDYVSFKID